MDVFAKLRDPRCRRCRYPLEEMLFTALCATPACWNKHAPLFDVPRASVREFIPT